MKSVKLKKIIALTLAIIVLAAAFAGCGAKGKTLLELDGSKISVNLFQLYLSRMKGTLCSVGYFGSAALKDSFWDTIVDAYEKTTYNTQYTDMVLDTAKSYLAALALFEERGLKLPDSYVDEIDEEMKNLVETVADGSKTTFNTMLAEYGANYDVLREAYVIEAKIAYLREDLFGANGSKIAPNLIDDYYRANYARFKQVFLYTYDPAYETDENGDSIYYKEDGKISYDTTKTLKKDANGAQVLDKNGDRVYVYTDDNGKERIAYKKIDAERKEILDENGDVILNHYTGEKKQKVIDKAYDIMERVKKGDTMSFDLLVTEYNEENGNETYPDGYYVTKDTAYASPEVIKELFTLEVGDYKMVSSEYGIHIIMRYELQDAAYDLDEYDDVFIANSTGNYIFMSDLTDKLLSDYVSSYKERVEVNDGLLDGVDMKSVGANYYY